MTLAETWEQLESQLPDGRDGRMVQRVYSDSPIDLFVWAQLREPRRALELHVPPEDAEFALPVATRGIAMNRRAQPAGPTVLSLELTDPTATQLFAVVCSDIAAAAAHCDDTQTAAAAWAGRYNRWRRLLERAPQGLSRRRQQGLYAELWALRELYAPCLGIDAAVESWVGPDQAARDFERGGHAVEVKSSTTNEPQIVTINGERQLDDTELVSLHLVHLSLEVLPRAGETLPEMVLSLRSLASDGPAESGLSDALLDAGYADHHAELYADVGYALRRLSVMHVREGFPRIVESDLDDGVGSVHYRLALDACRSNEVDRAALEQRLRDAHG